MIPFESLSGIPAPSPWKERANQRNAPLIDYERGGVALGDTTQGASSHEWRLEYIEPDFVLTREDASPSVVFSRPGITEVSLAFDQNMRPLIAFVDAGGAWIRWFDPLAGDMVFLSIPGATTPRVTLDIKGGVLDPLSDVILAYMHGTELRYRQQRDRFDVERTLKTGFSAGAELVTIGRNTGNRLQFRVRGEVAA